MELHTHLEYWVNFTHILALFLQCSKNEVNNKKRENCKEGKERGSNRLEYTIVRRDGKEGRRDMLVIQRGNYGNEKEGEGAEGKIVWEGEKKGKNIEEKL